MKVTTKTRDAYSQHVMYDGWDVGFVVQSTVGGQWPYASQYVHGVKRSRNGRQVYWPVAAHEGQTYRLPPEVDRWQSFRRLIAFRQATPEKRAVLIEASICMQRIDDLRAQDPNHADLSALQDQMRHITGKLDSEHGGY